MKIAIHTTANSFSDNWIKYCQQKNVEYKIVNCYESDIIKQLEDCDGLMWHWNHADYRAARFARQLTYSLEHAGKKVFPDSETSWHFDDKVGQKYLLESIGAPLAPTHVFYEKEKALTFIKEANFPLVFKLRNGAGSLNVRLIDNLKQASKIINRAFGKGFLSVQNKQKVLDRWKKLRKTQNINNINAFLRGLALYLFPRLSIDKKFSANEIGYVYFQQYISGVDHDIRVVVIGNRAFAIKRMVRKNDFKASGSGMIIHDQNQIPVDCVKLAFNLSNRLRTQCLAFDFIHKADQITLLEISYGFSSSGYLECPGYWDDQLTWHQGKFTPEYFMIEDLIQSIKNQI